MSRKGLRADDETRLLNVGARYCPTCDRLLMPHGHLIPPHKTSGSNHAQCPASHQPWQ